MMYNKWIFLSSFLYKNSVVNGHTQNAQLKESVDKDGLTNSFIPQKTDGDSDDVGVGAVIGTGGADFQSGVMSDTIIETVEEEMGLDLEGNGYSVKACRCTRESFDCLDLASAPIISQDENIVVCLAANSSEVTISNFYLRMTNGDQTFTYEPVLMGNGQWSVNSESLTRVANQGNKVRIETYPVQGLFRNNGDESKVTMSGNVFLEFASAKETTDLGLVPFGFASKF